MFSVLCINSVTIPTDVHKLRWVKNSLMWPLEPFFLDRTWSWKKACEQWYKLKGRGESEIRKIAKEKIQLVVRRLTELEIRNYFSLRFDSEVTFKTLQNADIPFTPPQYKIPSHLLNRGYIIRSCTVKSGSADKNLPLNTDYHMHDRQISLHVLQAPLFHWEDFILSTFKSVSLWLCHEVISCMIR